MKHIKCSQIKQKNKITISSVLWKRILFDEWVEAIHLEMGVVTMGLLEILEDSKIFFHNFEDEIQLQDSTLEIFLRVDQVDHERKNEEIRRQKKKYQTSMLQKRWKFHFLIFSTILPCL